MGTVSTNLNIEGGLVYLRDENDWTWEIFHISTLARVRVMDTEYEPGKQQHTTHEVFLEFNDGTRSPTVDAVSPHTFTSTELAALMNTWQRFLLRRHGT